MMLWYSCIFGTTRNIIFSLRSISIAHIPIANNVSLICYEAIMLLKICFQAVHRFRKAKFFWNLIICPIKKRDLKFSLRSETDIRSICTFVRYIFSKNETSNPPTPLRSQKVRSIYTFICTLFFQQTRTQVPPLQSHTYVQFIPFIRYIFKSKKKCIPLEISEIRKYKGFLYMFGGFSRLKFLHCQRLILETLLHTRQWCVCVCRSSLTFRYG